MPPKTSAPGSDQLAKISECLGQLTRLPATKVLSKSGEPFPSEGCIASLNYLYEFAMGSSESLCAVVESTNIIQDLALSIRDAHGLFPHFCEKMASLLLFVIENSFAYTTNTKTNKKSHLNELVAVMSGYSTIVKSDGGILLLTKIFDIFCAIFSDETEVAHDSPFLPISKLIIQMRDVFAPMICNPNISELWADLSDSYLTLGSECIRKDKSIRGLYESSGFLRFLVDSFAHLVTNSDFMEAFYLDSFLRIILNSFYPHPSNIIPTDTKSLFQSLIKVINESSDEEDSSTSTLASSIIVSIMVQNEAFSSILQSTGADETQISLLLNEVEQFKKLVAQVRNIQTNHFDEEEVSESLISISQVFHKSHLSQYFYVYAHHCFSVHFQCLSNIDENIMEATLKTTIQLISENIEAQEEFIHRGGIIFLRDGLKDYNTSIRTLCLRILQILISQNEDVKTIVRRSSILESLLQIISQFPAEDITPTILELSMAIVANSLIDNDQNQEYIMNKKGAHFICRFLKDRQTIRQQIGDAPVIAILEKSFVVLGNLTYKNIPLQDELRESRLIETVYGFLVDEFIKAPSSPTRERIDLYVACLNLMINFSDTNQTNQNYINSFFTLDTLLKLLQSNLINITSLTCLLLSHLSWNNPTNQVKYGTKPVVTRVLELISQSPVEESPDTMKANTSWRTNQGARDRYDLCTFALMALVNLSFQQAAVQNVVYELKGIKVVASQLWSAHYDCRATSAFCLGNLVKSHPDNSRLFCECGGIERICGVLNDADEDQLSNRAFAVLSNTQEFGLEAIVKLYAEAVSSIQKGGQQKIEAAEKYLSIINGLICKSLLFYNHNSCKIDKEMSYFFSEQNYIPKILCVLQLSYVPMAIKELSLYVAENIIISRQTGIHSKEEEELATNLCKQIPLMKESRAARNSLYKVITILCLKSPGIIAILTQPLKSAYAKILADASEGPATNEEERQKKEPPIELILAVFAATKGALSADESSRTKSLLSNVSQTTYGFPLLAPKASALLK